MPMVSTVPTEVTSTKTGSKLRNDDAKSKSHPGLPPRERSDLGSFRHSSGVEDSKERRPDAARYDAKRPSRLGRDPRCKWASSRDFRDRRPTVHSPARLRACRRRSA